MMGWHDHLSISSKRVKKLKLLACKILPFTITRYARLILDWFIITQLTTG
jgi:hypothetical protein